MPQQFEPMSVGRILDRAFRLYKQNLVRFLAIAAVIQVPLGLLNLVPQYFFVWRGSAPAGPPGAAGIAGILVGVLVAWLAGALCNAALIKSISESYLGNEVSVGEAYGFVLPRILTVMAVGLLTGLIISVGFALCVVPGIIFALWLVLTTQAVVVEDAGVFEALKRSKSLVAGNLGKVFLLGLAVWVLSWLVGVAFGQGGMLLGRTIGGDYVPQITGQLSQLLGRLLIMPVQAGAFILLYYDLRIRKEGFDLEMLAERMGSAGGDEVAAP